MRLWWQSWHLTSHCWCFFTAALAIVPLVGWIARATEDLVRRTSDQLGGLLNATFGNAADLIIGLSALHVGLDEVVEASFVGSIVGTRGDRHCPLALMGPK